MQRVPKENRCEFVVIASQRARQLLAGAVPRETGAKKVTIAKREVLGRKVQKVDGDGAVAGCRLSASAADIEVTPDNRQMITDN